MVFWSSNFIFGILVPRLNFKLYLDDVNYSFMTWQWLKKWVLLTGALKILIKESIGRNCLGNASVYFCLSNNYTTFCCKVTYFSTLTNAPRAFISILLKKKVSPIHWSSRIRDTGKCPIIFGLLYAALPCFLNKRLFSKLKLMTFQSRDNKFTVVPTFHLMTWQWLLDVFL